MAFVAIDPTQIEVGKAVRKELWTKTKDNLDDLDTRLTAQESVGEKIVIINSDIVNLAQYANGSTLNALFVYEAPLDLNLITCELTVSTAGTSGAVEGDIRIGPNRTTLSSVFSTRPSVDFSAGDDATSNNQVFAVTEVDEGELIVFDILTIQQAMGRLHVKILGEPR